jgi:hypothetical protein
VNRTVLYALAVCIVAVLGVGVNDVLYTQRETRAAERRAEATAEANLRNLCGFVVVIDDAYAKVPPAGDAARRFAEEIHRLRSALHCDQHPSPVVSDTGPVFSSPAPTPGD